MWLSLNILSNMIDLKGIDPEELAHRLTMSTAEIDSIDYMNDHFKTIFTARVADIKAHPNADKLTLVDVDTGSKKYRVVCGAKNFKTGDIVPIATVDTRFSDEFTIRKTKIRGLESEGMLCSERELGLSDDHSGIMILPRDTETGIPLSELFPQWVDVRLEIDNKSITHRPDLWSHAGFAREIGALYKRPVKNVINYSLTENFTNKEKLKVTIENADACPRYSGLAVSNIKVEESPQWLKAMVTSIGMRPINNIVDITNYVMAEIGEPMHAFDKKKLKGDEIIVRMAENGEYLKTLDDQEHELTPEDIVIADSEGSVALAGVMGGGNSEIENNTETIVLEAANFNPVNIRRTSQKYGLRTEASVRFEKSLTPHLTRDAIIRCYDLIKQVIPEAEAVTEIIDAYPKKQNDIFVNTSTEFIRRKIGAEITDERIIEILSSLNFDIQKEEKDLKIKVPHYRATKDISIPDDIVEEVGRIYGYDNIKEKAPFISCAPPEENSFRLFERKVKNILSTHCNMTEYSGYSFVGEDILNKLEINHDKELRLRNPLSQDQDRLRRNLIPNIINVIELNQKYHEEFFAYEMGRAYIKDNRKSPDLVSEKHITAGVIFKKQSQSPVFYEAKKSVLLLFDRLRLKNVKLIPSPDNLPPYAHPGRSMTIEIDGTYGGIIFELHPKTRNTFGINGHAGIFELDLDLIFNSEKNEIKFTELQKFPEVPFEISVIADKFVYSENICRIIEKSRKNYINSVDVISVYEGDPIPEDKKSVSLKIIFAAKDKTLTPDEIDNLQKKVIADLNREGYTLR